jgi:cytochrome c-type biogenesis protein CcmH
VPSRSLLRLLAGLLVLIALAMPALARADAIDDSVRRIALQLQCPVCEGESVADSPSGLATDMRALIRTRVAAGVSDQAILDEFVASYGDSILTEPPKRGISLGVWLGPVVGVVLGAAVLGLLLWTWRHAPGRAPGLASAAATDAEVADEFRRFREEFGR